MYVGWIYQWRYRASTGQQSVKLSLDALSFVIVVLMHWLIGFSAQKKEEKRKMRSGNIVAKIVINSWTYWRRDSFVLCIDPGIPIGHWSLVMLSAIISNVCIPSHPLSQSHRSGCCGKARANGMWKTLGGHQLSVLLAHPLFCHLAPTYLQSTFIKFCKTLWNTELFFNWYINLQLFG